MLHKLFSFGVNASFRRQLTTFVVLGSIFISFSASLLVAYIVSGLASEYMESSGKQIVKGLSKQSVLAAITESSTNGKGAVEQILGFPEVTAAAIILLDGDILLMQGEQSLEYQRNQLSQITKPSLLFNSSDYWIFAAPIKIEVEDIEIETSFDIEEIDTTPLETDILGYSLVRLTKERLYQANRLILQYSIVIGLVGASIFALILNFGLSQLTQPLTRLSKVMEKSQQSGEHLFAKVEGAREVQQIAITYNRMMEALDTQDDELRLHRDQLESEVSMRTRELLEARDSALTASRHKSEFLANMSHELRTPIQAIIGYVDLVREELEFEAKYHLVEDLDRVTRSSQRLLYLINSILDFAKIEAGQMDINISEVRVGQVISNVVDTIQPLLANNHNRLSVTGESIELMVTTDVEKLEQILVNLMSNACKFTQKGDIYFSAEISIEHIIFSVEDTGIGIPEDKIDSIFNEFQQIDSGQDRKFQGTGLGLAISKQYCELIQGRIKVSSLIDSGSKFTVTIPKVVRRF